jgi:uncharacterized protein YutE (UPF0331/DUF86 family)
MTAVETERRVLDMLRPRFEAAGFTFIERPSPTELPSFMQGYKPDALALGKDKSIAIEVKVRRGAEGEKSLRMISERFKGRTNWEFRIVYADEIEYESIETPTREQIVAQVKEAETLLLQEHPTAALVLGWAAIEAIARTLIPDFPSRGPHTLRQAIELLEHLGRLEYDEANELRRLLPLRAKVVHGDFRTIVSTDEVEPVLKAARAALEAA